MIQDYFNKSGDTKLEDGKRLSNEHGFLIYRLGKDAIYVMHCYGDGKYWDKVLEKIARKYMVPKIVFGTKRNYKAFQRKFGYKMIGYILEKEVK